MVIMEPCGRLRVILTQMIDSIVAGARPGNKEEFRHLIEDTMPRLESRAHDLAEKCRTSGGCDDVLCDRNSVHKVFENAYANLENKYSRYEEIKKGDPHLGFGGKT